MADEFNESIKRRQEQLDELNETLERQSELVQEQAKAKEEYISLINDEEVELKHVLRLQKQLQDAQESGSTSVEDIRKEYEEWLKVLSLTDQALARQLEAMAKKRAEMKKLREARKKQQKALDAEKRAVSEANKAYEKKVKALKAVGGALDKVTKSSMSQLFSLKGLAEEMINFAYAQQNAQVELARTTGYGKAFQNNLTTLMKENKALGLTLEENTKILGSLSTRMARFNALSDAQQNSLAVVGARFMRLGASTESTAELFDRLNYAFGVTGASAISAAGDIEALSDRLGRPIGSVIEDLNSLGPELSRFGQAGLKVFEKLAVQARELGLSVKQAFDMSELFDTFEGAANVAGRLNAQLGLQLNSVQLMKASSEERIELLRQEFALQGKNINSMGRRQQQMIASILQTDVESARRLLGDRMDIRKFQKQRSPEKRMDDFITAQEKMNGFMQQLMMPMAHMMAGLMDGMMNLVGIMADYAPQALRALGHIATAIYVTSVMRGGGAGMFARGGPKPGGRPKFNRTGSGGSGGSGRFTTGGRRLPGSIKPRTPTPSAAGGGLSGLSRFAKIGAYAGGGLLSGGIDAAMEYSATGDAGRAAKVGGSSALGFGLGMAAGTLFGPAAVVMSPLLGMLGSYLGGSAARSMLGEAKPKEQESDKYDAKGHLDKVTKEYQRTFNKQKQEIVVNAAFNVEGRNWANQTVKVFNNQANPFG